MLRNYYRQLLAFIFILTSITANGQGFGVSTSARYADGCRLDFYNSTNVKIFSLRGSELRYTYNSSGQIIVRDENIQITDVFGISGLAALIDSVQSICLAGLCSSTTPPTEFSFCGSPIWDFWRNNVGASADNDTLGGGAGLSLAAIDNTIFIYLSNSGLVFEDYFWGNCLGGIYSQQEIDTCANQQDLNCSKIINTDYIVNQGELISIDSSAELAKQSYTWTFTITDFDTISVTSHGYTLSNDTTIKNDICIGINDGLAKVLRPLGIKITDIVNDTSLIYISATPIKTSGQTYATNSFKIQKLAYADIDAPVINEQVYNPNLGEQTKSLAISTGKNTYCIQVEDTQGNIAYTIFQLTKTAL